MQNTILQLHIPSVLCMSKILYVDFVWSTLNFRSYDVIDWLDCLVCHDHISRGVDHTKSTYKNIASSDHTKSTYKTRSQKSTYKKKGPKKTVLKLICLDHKKSLICSDHIGRSHKLTYKSVIATYKVWSATYKRLRLSRCRTSNIHVTPRS
jgi:hypothetical protein